MKKYQYEFAVVGGDARIRYLAENLADKGRSICVYGLSSRSSHQGCINAASFVEAVTKAAVIVGPVPLMQGEDRISNKSGHEDMTVSRLLDNISTEQLLIAACIPETMKSSLIKKNIWFHDYMKDDKIVIFNSIATAEGVIAEAVTSFPANLHDSRALVLGYGKCAKTLANKLKWLTKETVVCVRSEEQSATADAFGLGTMSYQDLADEIGSFQLIFNTVPSVVLDEHVLKNVSPNAMILDIATAPGGVDYEMAKKMGISAKLYPGLPGRYSPRSSGEALAAYVIEKSAKK